MEELDTKIKKECAECGKLFESKDDSAYCSFKCAYGINVL